MKSGVFLGEWVNNDDIDDDGTVEERERPEPIWEAYGDSTGNRDLPGALVGGSEGLLEEVSGCIQSSSIIVGSICRTGE